MNSNTFERLQLNEVKDLIKIHCVSSQEFETIIQKKLTKEQIFLLKSFVFFTNKYASLNEDMDLISTE
ncbi:hypothetical protein ACTPEF_26090, partial [Clostridioides difficile]